MHTALSIADQYSVLCTLLSPEHSAECKKRYLNQHLTFFSESSCLKLLTDQSLVPRVSIALKELGLLEKLTPAAKLVYEFALMRNRKRNQAILAQLQEICAQPEIRDCEIVALKGSAMLIAGDFSDIGERISFDIDLLVQPDNEEKFIKVLRQCGYKQLDVSFIDDHEIGTFLPPEHHLVSIDLHRKLPGSDCIGESLLKDLLISRHKGQGCFDTLSKLTPAANLATLYIHHMIHDRRHSGWGIKLVRNIDLILTIRRYQQSYFEVAELFKNRNLVSRFEKDISFARILFSPPIDDRIRMLRWKMIVATKYRLSRLMHGLRVPIGVILLIRRELSKSTLERRYGPFKSRVDYPREFYRCVVRGVRRFLSPGAIRYRLELLGSQAPRRIPTSE